jgi:hypothetical protein
MCDCGKTRSRFIPRKRRTNVAQATDAEKSVFLPNNGESKDAGNVLTDVTPYSAGPCSYNGEPEPCAGELLFDKLDCGVSGVVDLNDYECVDHCWQFECPDYGEDLGNAYWPRQLYNHQPCVVRPTKYGRNCGKKLDCSCGNKKDKGGKSDNYYLKFDTYKKVEVEAGEEEIEPNFSRDCDLVCTTPLDDDCNPAPPYSKVFLGKCGWTITFKAKFDKCAGELLANPGDCMVILSLTKYFNVGGDFYIFALCRNIDDELVLKVIKNDNYNVTVTCYALEDEDSLYCWNCYAFVYDTCKNQLLVYLNGELLESDPEVEDNEESMKEGVSKGGLCIGWFGEAGDEEGKELEGEDGPDNWKAFWGCIDDLYIFKVTFDQEQIEHLCDYGKIIAFKSICEWENEANSPAMNAYVKTLTVPICFGGCSPIDIGDDICNPQYPEGDHQPERCEKVVIEKVSENGDVCEIAEINLGNIFSLPGCDVTYTEISDNCPITYHVRACIDFGDLCGPLCLLPGDSLRVITQNGIFIKSVGTPVITGYLA